MGLTQRRGPLDADRDVPWTIEARVWEALETEALGTGHQIRGAGFR